MAKILQPRFMALPVTGPQTYEIANSYLQKQYLRARFQIETGEYDEEDMTKDNPPATGASPGAGLARDEGPKEAPPPGEWTLGEDLRYSWSGDDAKSDLAQRWLFTVLKQMLEPRE